MSTFQQMTKAAEFLKRKRISQFEIYLEKKKATQLQVKENAIDGLSQAEDVGMSVRVLQEGKMGFSFTTSLLDEAVEKACNTAVAISNEMESDSFARFACFSDSHYPEIDAYDESGPEVSTKEKLQLALELEAQCRSVDKRITGIRAASLGETLYEVHLLDSDLNHLFHRGSFYSASITCKAEQDGQSQMGGDYRFSNYLNDLPLKETALEAAKSALQLLGAKKAPTQVVPAVLCRSVMADLIDFLLPSFYAEEIDKGRSLLAGKKGENIFSRQFTLLQDGLLPGGYGTMPFDGEGIPAKKFEMVRDGVFVEEIFDLYFAAKLKGKPSGCASRSIKSPPSTSTANVLLKPGEKTFDELVRAASTGIYITDLMGVHTANPVTGDFSLGASGILIEKGVLTTPVKGFAVAGNILELLKSIVAVGNDMRSFGTVWSGSVLIEKLSIGGE